MYQVFLLRSTRNELARLHPVDSERAYEAILGLAENPRPPGVKKLEEGKGWRIRVGNYRIVYTIDDSARQVTVFKVGHRRDVYRRL